MAALGLAVISATSAMAVQWQPVYQTDFSSDPLWTTNNPSRYYWDAANQTNDVHQINVDYGGYYAYKDVGHDGTRPFRLDFDINISKVDYAANARLGLFDSDLNTDWYYGSYAMVMFSNEDAGRVVHLWAVDSSNIRHEALTHDQFSLDTPYHVSMEYDPAAETISAEVTLRDSGAYFTSVSLIGVGPFAPDTGLLGSSNYRPTGTFQSPGAESTAQFDNVTFYEAVPEPPTVTLLGAGLLSLLACVWRRRLAA
jgi:hypothetical protein